jgi:hypothetical protein
MLVSGPVAIIARSLPYFSALYEMNRKALCF